MGWFNVGPWPVFLWKVQNHVTSQWLDSTRPRSAPRSGFTASLTPSQARPLHSHKRTRTRTDSHKRTHTRTHSRHMRTPARSRARTHTLAR
jgi:hypothetical protein